MKNILITGGSGLIGRRLSELFVQQGYSVSHLSRSPRSNSPYQVYYWNPEAQEMDTRAIQNADAIVHLAGENIGGGRWTKKRKQSVVASRVNTGNLLTEKLQEIEHKVRVVVSASAIGYYGAVTSEKIFMESDPPASDFMGETCRLWEAPVNKISSINTRTVTLRIGIVLSPKGGALQKLLLPVKWGVGAPLGSGKQFMPWVHIDDIADIFLKAIEEESMNGVYNAVAPSCETNRSFTRALAKVARRPLIMPAIPAFLLRALLGEMSDMVLKGSQVSSEKLIGSGFEFRYPSLELALRDLLEA